MDDMEHHRLPCTDLACGALYGKKVEPLFKYVVICQCEYRISDAYDIDMEVIAAFNYLERVMALISI